MAAVYWYCRLDQKAGILQQLCRFSQVSISSLVQRVKLDNKKKWKKYTMSGLVKESMLGGLPLLEVGCGAIVVTYMSLV
jgi:hypothetical protein